jgi:glycosyltransferase involved in cell wall biosynthesis
MGAVTGIMSDLRTSSARPSTPKVSMGMPVYNVERYLDESIESLLSQTFRDIELIISDNGSTDGTPGICRRWAQRDSRIRFERSEVNRGLAWNHNHVSELARGEYFMWAPADDRFAPSYVRRCVEVLDGDPGVVYVYGTTVLTDSEGNVIGREVNRYDLTSESISVRFWDQLVVRGGQNFYGVMRTSVLHRIGPHRTFPWAERVIFTELSLFGRFHLLPGAGYFRRLHEGQVSAIRDASHRVDEAMILDPRRASRWRHIPTLMKAEYVVAFFAAVKRAPLDPQVRRQCFLALLRWVLSHVPGFRLRDPRAIEVLVEPAAETVPVRDARSDARPHDMKLRQRR